MILGFSSCTARQSIYAESAMQRENTDTAEKDVSRDSSKMSAESKTGANVSDAASRPSWSKTPRFAGPVLKGLSLVKHV